MSQMDLSAFPLGDAVRVEVLEQTIAGGQPGVVVHCVLEVQYRSGGARRVEMSFDEANAYNFASFRAFITALNRTLAKNN